MDWLIDLLQPAMLVAAAPLAALVLSRLINNNALYKIVFKGVYFFTSTAEKKIGKKLWGVIEKQLKQSVHVVARAISDGCDSTDGVIKEGDK